MVDTGCDWLGMVWMLPLFWAAPNPDVRGPGADSGSRLRMVAPAPGKKMRLQAAPAPDPKIFILSSEKCKYY